MEARAVRFNNHMIRKAFGDRWLRWLERAFWRAFNLPMDIIMMIMRINFPLQIKLPKWVHSPRGSEDTLAVDPNGIDPNNIQGRLPGTIQRYTWHRGTQLAYREGSGSSPPWPYWLPPRRKVLIRGRYEGRG